MFIHEMGTPNPQVWLVRPEVARDAALGVEWLAGEQGRETLRLMGVSERENKPTTIEQERQRVTDFLEKPDQRNWMIELEGRVVGAIWVDLKPTQHMPAPSVHLMIGDPKARGQGAGSAALRAVLDWLRTNEALYSIVYSRHLVANEPIKTPLRRNGFVDLGDPYRDADGLEWQNVYLHQQRIIQQVAAKAIIRQNDKILVLRQASEAGVSGGGLCHPPGGVVEPGESLQDALRRETKEEAGLEVDVRELLAADEWQREMRGEYTQFFGLFFTCTIAPDSPPLKVNDQESTEALWIGVDELEKVDIAEPSRSIIKRVLTGVEQA